MINVKIGNILLEHSGIIVHGCNCFGVMGAGVAKAIKETYPIVYIDYITRGRSIGYKLGDVIETVISDKLIICSALTQMNYGRDRNIIYVDYNAINTAFIHINRLALRTGLDVKFPLIGSGLGNGDPSIINNIIDSKLDDSINKILFIHK